jgi:hypothetical protein
MRLRLKADKPACVQKAVLNALCGLNYMDQSLAYSFCDCVCEQFRIDSPGLCNRLDHPRNIIKLVCYPFCLFLDCVVSNLLFNLASVFVERVKVV